MSTALPGQMPPANCQRCSAVAHSISSTAVHRWTCGRMLHMHPACAFFDPLPNGRQADPAPNLEGTHHE